MAGSINTIATSLDTEEFDAGVFREGVEHAYSVAATSDTSNDCVWELAALLQQLSFGLVANHGLESSDNCREWMWSNGGTKYVVSGVELHNPGTESFVNCVAQRARSGLNCDYLGAEEPYPKNIKGLSSNIFLIGY